MRRTLAAAMAMVMLCALVLAGCSEQAPKEIKKEEVESHESAEPQTPVQELRECKGIIPKGEIVTIAGEFIYYTETGNTIYRAPLSRPGEGEAIYSLEDVNAGVYDLVGIYPSGNAALLSYHTDGAVMGSYHSILLPPEGDAEELGAFIATSYIQGCGIEILAGNAPMQGGTLGILQIRREGEESFADFAKGKFNLGTYYAEENGYRAAADSFALIGNAVYMIGQEIKGEQLGAPGVYCVDIKTGEVRRVFEESAKWFSVNGNEICVVDKDGFLWQGTLDGKKLTKASEVKVEKAWIRGTEIFYSQHETGAGLYKMSDGKSVVLGRVQSPMTSPAKEDGRYLTLMACPLDSSPARGQGVVIDLSGGVFITDPKAPVAAIGVTDGTIYEIRTDAKL